MAKPTVKLEGEASSIKQKQGRPAKECGASKRIKKTGTSSFYLVFDPILIAGKDFYSHMIPLYPTP